MDEQAIPGTSVRSCPARIPTSRNDRIVPKVRRPLARRFVFWEVRRAHRQQHHHAVRGQAPVQNVSVKFGEGNRYGLIRGQHGAGKSTFMKILAGVLEPGGGNVSLDSGERMASSSRTSSPTGYPGARRGDDGPRGHVEVHAGKGRHLRQSGRRPKTTTCTPPSSKASSPNTTATPPGTGRRTVAGGGHPHRTAWRRDEPCGAGLEAAGAAVPGLVRQSDILLLDEPTNNLDIDTIRWLEDVLNQREAR